MSLDYNSMDEHARMEQDVIDVYIHHIGQGSSHKVAFSRTREANVLDAKEVRRILNKRRPAGHPMDPVERWNRERVEGMIAKKLTTSAMANILGLPMRTVSRYVQEATS